MSETTKVDPAGGRCVRNIEVCKFLVTGRYCASCFGPKGSPHGRLEQWGETADEAAKNLRTYIVEVFGYSWPVVEK